MIFGGIKICNSKFALSLMLLISIFFSYSPGNALAEESDQAFQRFWPDNLFAVDFVDNNNGFIAGYSGTFLRTTDAGENWEAYYIGRNELIRRISFVDVNTGWAIGHRGSIFHTTDGGKSWSVQLEVKNTYLRDVDFADARNGWVVGHDANIWHTSDGGNSWQQQKLLGFPGRDVPRLHGVYAKDENTAFLVGEFGVVGHTENGGQTWLVTPTDSDITYLSIAGNNNNIYVVGLDGTIAKLTTATEKQRTEINKKVAEKAAKAKAKAIAKAKRKKRKYVEKKSEPLPESDVEYLLTDITSNTNEHLFDVDVAQNGDALIVGRSSVIRVSGVEASMLTPKDQLPLAFVWLGGVAILPDQTFWAPGIRGVVVKGDLEKMSFKQGVHLAASKNIKLVTSRWGNESE